jgi:hypothetical protein
VSFGKNNDPTPFLEANNYSRQEYGEIKGLPMPSRTERFGLMTSFEFTMKMSPM